MEWCRWPTVVPGGHYVAPSGGCGTAQRVTAIQTNANNCFYFDGRTTGWSWCTADLCKATSTSNPFTAAHVYGSCQEEDRAGFWFLHYASLFNCRLVSGVDNYPNEPDTNQIYCCHFEACHL